MSSTSSSGSVASLFLRHACPSRACDPLFCKKLTVKTFADAKSSIKAEVGKSYNADLLNGKRVIRVSYRGLDVPVEATTMQDQITLRCAAYMKSRAVASKVLEPCEDTLMAIDSEQNGPPTRGIETTTHVDELSAIHADLPFRGHERGWRDT